jgi:hypothetical protein
VLERARFLLREDDHLPRPLRKPLEHLGERLPPQTVNADAAGCRCARVDSPVLGRALEERRLEGTTRLGEQDVAREAGKELEQLLDVPALVEEIRAEHEVPGRALEQPRRLSPSDEFHLDPGSVALRVRRRHAERVRRPVRGQHVGTAERRDDARQREPAPELDDAQPREAKLRDRAGERDRRRPQLRPVGQELLVLEGLLVEQRLRVPRSEQQQPPPADVDDFLDEVER